MFILPFYRVEVSALLLSRFSFSVYLVVCIKYVLNVTTSTNSGRLNMHIHITLGAIKI